MFPTPNCIPEGGRTAAYQRDMCCRIQRWPGRGSYGAVDLGLEGVWSSKKKGSTCADMKNPGRHGDLEPTAEMMESKETSSLVDGDFVSGHLVPALRAHTPVSCHDVGQMYVFFRSHQKDSANVLFL